MNEPAFTKYIDLASERLGGKALYCTDDFFAEKENLLKPGRGVFIPDKYTDRGKWMDGWESRRKRTEGHDWCVIRLATSGRIYGVDIDTNHFLGNHPPFASLEGAFIEEDETITDYETINWKEILPSSPLEPGSHNYYEITESSPITHLRLHIYPDGGVARLKVYGEVVKDWSTVNTSETINLAAATNGARAVLCNDMFFSHMDNLLLPGRGVNMGDGWETKRNRTPGNCDWVIIRLAHKGIIDRILVDTCHFKGNYPDSCQVDGCTISLKEETKLNDPALEWKTILPKAKLSADHEHYFEKELVNKEPVTHIRLSIYPDGGISRLKLWGRISNR